MVEVHRGALRLVVQATLVQLKGRLAGVNGHGDGPEVGDGRLQRPLRALAHVEVAVDGGADGLIAEATPVVPALVRVALLGVHAAIGEDVVEGGVHQTAAAAGIMAIVGAVDDVLLGKGHQLAGLQRVLALDGGNGGEGPA